MVDRIKLADAVAKALPPPVPGTPEHRKGYKITFDTEVPRFGVRVTNAGGRSFIVEYPSHGRERSYTIGRIENWRCRDARAKAREVLRRLPDGIDPLDEVARDREAKTVAVMCKLFVEEHFATLRPDTRRNYAAMIRDEILPALGKRKVADIRHNDIVTLHRKISQGSAEHKPRRYVANRVASLLHSMFEMAVHRWEWIERNPCKGLRMNSEEKRRRYLKNGELVAVTAAFVEYENRPGQPEFVAMRKQAANILRMLLLTGARRGEMLNMKWADVDLAEGRWIKPGSTVKQKTDHEVPLSAPARQLLAGLDRSGEYVFPGRWGDARVQVRRAWSEICKIAGIEGARIHDLRHSFASHLVSAGYGLPLIGALLGHTQAATTHRYAHLILEAQREATERVGQIIINAGKPGAEVIEHRRSRR